MCTLAKTHKRGSKANKVYPLFIAAPWWPGCTTLTRTTTGTFPPNAALKVAPLRPRWIQNVLIIVHKTCIAAIAMGYGYVGTYKSAK